jgi:hypothetical protein
MLQWWQNLVGKRAEAAHRAKRDNPTDHQTAAVYQKSAPNSCPWRGPVRHATSIHLLAAAHFQQKKTDDRLDQRASARLRFL